MIFIYLQLFIHNFMDLFGEGGGREEWRNGGREGEGGREGGRGEAVRSCTVLLLTALRTPYYLDM